MHNPKINSRIFESEDEQRKHTGAEFYNTYMGEDYEKEMMAAVERVISSKYDPRHFEASKGPIRTKWTVFIQPADIAEDAIMSVLKI